MNLNKHDRAYLAEEIAILLTETYAVGSHLISPTSTEALPGFMHASESKVKATVLEAINRTLDSRLALPADKPLL